MATVKTASSVEKSLFNEVDTLAEEMQIARSQLFVLAVEEFIERHRNRKMLEALNEVYADEPGSSDEFHRQAMRRRHKQLVEGQW